MAWGKTLKWFYYRWVFLLSFIAVIHASANSLTNDFLIQTINALPNLAISSVTNGQVQMLLHAEPGIPHIIESSPDLVNWSCVTTNSENATNRLINLPASTDACYFRVSRCPIPIFAYALAAKMNMDLNGSGILFDSWNSHDTNQSWNGYYDGYAGTNGDIAVAQGIADIGFHIINGDLYLGSEASLYISSGGGITGQIYPDSHLLFPDVALPDADTIGNPIVWSPAPGTSSSHSFTSAGYYVLSDNGSISVEPGTKVSLLINSTNYSPASINIKGGTTNAGTVVMYQISGTATLGGSFTGGAINNRPENFAYYGLPGVSKISFQGGSTFVGMVYAPATVGLFSYGGPGSLDFLGSCIVSDATVNGHVFFHYDTSLKTNGPCR